MSLRGVADGESPFRPTLIVSNATRKPPAKRRRKATWRLTLPWNPRAALRPVRWGERDAALGALVCRCIAQAMPPTVVEWQWQRRIEPPAWMGWVAVVVIVALVLMGAR